MPGKKSLWIELRWTPYFKRKNEELAAIVTFKHGADAHSLLTSGLEHKIREKQIVIKPIPKSLKIEPEKGLKKKRNRSKSNQRPVKSDDELTELKAKCFDLETQNRLLTKKLNAANATARSQKTEFDAKLSGDWQKSAKIL